MDAIILAGGFGTRLKTISKGVPKSLMPIGDKVFLDILIDRLILSQIDNIYLSLHYKPELFINYISHNNKKKKLIPIIEPNPLGTGGGINYVVNNSSISECFYVINGDTFSNINYDMMNEAYTTSNYDCIVGISFVNNCSRFGKINFKNNQLIGFDEKSSYSKGWINNGIYIMNKQIFRGFKGNFSIEHDVFPKIINEKKVGIFKVQNDNFFDIGIPSDYKKLYKRLAQGVRNERV